MKMTEWSVLAVISTITIGCTFLIVKDILLLYR